MNWFFIALIGPILYALANHTDKYLISKYLKNGAVGSLVIFSSIFSIFALPVVMYIEPNVFDVNIALAIILAINGALVVISIVLYFYALQVDEVSFVVPFYQTIPIFGFILGYFILGETLNFNQGLASLIILVGALILSFEVGLGKIRFKKKVVLLMLTASLFYAINGVVFKLIAIDDGFWPSTFWSLVGKVILGFAFLAFIPSYRKQFFEVLKANKASILAINSFNETAVIVADGVTQFASLLAPVALVLLVNAFQPAFVFIIGLILTIFLPKIAEESLNRTNLIQKILGIGIIILGTYLLAV